MSDEQQSSTPKFREGDIISHRERFFQGEAVVVGLSRDGCGDPVVACHGSAHTLTGVLCTLLRRPVRVGDVLRGIGANTEEIQIQADAGDQWDVAQGGTLYKAQCERWWTHADGTPIEPPQTKAEPKVEKKPDYVESIVGAYGVTRERFDEMKRRAENAERALQAQSGDFAMRRDMDREAMYEQTQELMWLKRELRRLDPRLYRARYERGGGR